MFVTCSAWQLQRIRVTICGSCGVRVVVWGVGLRCGVIVVCGSHCVKELRCGGVVLCGGHGGYQTLMPFGVF